MISIKFNLECDTLNESLNVSRKSLLSLLSNSKPKTISESIDKAEQLKLNLLSLKVKVDELILKSKSIVPFKSRKGGFFKLTYPDNRCKCLINFKRNQISMQKDQELIIQDVCDGITWKLSSSSSNHSEHTFTMPSVLFSLLPNQIELSDSMSLLLKRCDDLYKEAYSCQRQFKKDKIFAQMNIIKTCELEEVKFFLFFVLFEIEYYNLYSTINKYEQRKQSTDKELNLELLLKHIRTDIDSLAQETHSNSASFHNLNGRLSATDDLKLLNESFEKCVIKLKDLADISHIKGTFLLNKNKTLKKIIIFYFYSYC